MKKKIKWIVIAIVIVGIAFYFMRPKEAEDKYVTSIVSKADVVQTVSVTGEVYPVNKADLSFEGTGTVDEIYVEVGDEVKKGDKVAKLDTSVMRSQLNEAYIELDRQTELLQQIRRMGWDKLSPDEKAAAKLTEEKARAATWTLQRQITTRGLIYAPIDGIITKKYLEVGELSGLGGKMVTIMGEGGLELKAKIPESDIAKVEIGQKAKITFDAFSSDDVFEAEVYFIEPAATLIQDVVYYEIKLKLLDNINGLKSGMSADIDIATAEKDGVLAVPGQAVKGEDGKKYVEVIVLNKDGEREAEKVDVKAGLRGDDGLVEIMSGLEEGQEVVTFVNQ